MRVPSSWLFIFTILALAPAVVAAQSADSAMAEAYIGGPAAPMVRSGEFPDQSTWYRSEDAVFSWELTPEITAVSAELSDEPAIEPQKTYRPPVSSIAIGADQLHEGVQYLLVQLRNAEKWGMYAAYKVMIDDTPPAPFSISLAEQNGERSGFLATFETTDAASGLSYYNVSINGSFVGRVDPGTAARGYFIPVTAAGAETLSIQAVDNAGNIREAAASIYAVTPPLIDPTDDPLGYASAEPAAVLAAVMAALLLLIFGYMVYERQRYAHDLRRLREETGEIETEMLKVFSALREEIYDQINAINRKPRLTKKEKEAIDGLNKALLVSEKLLQKEVKDVKKILN